MNDSIDKSTSAFSTLSLTPNCGTNNTSLSFLTISEIQNSNSPARLAAAAVVSRSFTGDRATLLEAQIARFHEASGVRIIHELKRATKNKEVKHLHKSKNLHHMATKSRSRRRRQQRQGDEQEQDQEQQQERDITIATKANAGNWEDGDYTADFEDEEGQEEEVGEELKKDQETGGNRYKSVNGFLDADAIENTNTRGDCSSLNSTFATSQTKMNNSSLFSAASSLHHQNRDSSIKNRSKLVVDDGTLDLMTHTYLRHPMFVPFPLSPVRALRGTSRNEDDNSNSSFSSSRSSSNRSSSSSSKFTQNFSSNVKSSSSKGKSKDRGKGNGKGAEKPKSPVVALLLKMAEDEDEGNKQKMLAAAEALS